MTPLHLLPPTDVQRLRWAARDVVVAIGLLCLLAVVTAVWGIP